MPKNETGKTGGHSRAQSSAEAKAKVFRQLKTSSKAPTSSRTVFRNKDGRTGSIAAYGGRISVGTYGKPRLLPSKIEPVTVRLAAPIDLTGDVVARPAGVGDWVVKQHPSSEVTIEGLSFEDAQEALKLLHAARELQARLGAASVKAMVATVMEADLELTPPASVEQARRVSDLRAALLATPVYTYETLGEVRGDATSSATRTWVSRMRERRKLFTVTVNGRAVIPAFQLTDTGESRPELSAVLAELVDGDVDVWSMWTWLVHSTPLLSGDVPEQAVRESPERAVRAARRFASASRSAA